MAVNNTGLHGRLSKNIKNNRALARQAFIICFQGDLNDLNVHSLNRLIFCQYKIAVRVLVTLLQKFSFIIVLIIIAVIILPQVQLLQ